MSIQEFDFTRNALRRRLSDMVSSFCLQHRTAYAGKGIILCGTEPEENGI